MTDKTRSDRAPIVRFAPSPTGYLHIGGARTALFNWLYAAAAAASSCCASRTPTASARPEAAVEAILDGLEWLGLDWDGEPVYQFARAERHREVAEELLAARPGLPLLLRRPRSSTRCARRRAGRKGRSQIYDGPWRDRDPGEAPPASARVIRLKAPREGETVIDDQVQGRVVVANTELDDLIILRSDGTPTYNLAVVVDDHDMGITHVIRGVDHLTNAARQMQIYEAMGWEVPVFAHVPLIHGPDGAKLSKRHGALGVEAYRDMGYLPAALRNYLVAARLEPRRRRDHLDRAGGRLVRSRRHRQAPAARFDFAKLDDLNGHYIRSTSDAELMRRLEDILPDRRRRRRDRRAARRRTAGTGSPPPCRA